MSGVRGLDGRSCVCQPEGSPPSDCGCWHRYLCPWIPELKQVRAELEAKLEAQSVCDCHTWPTVKELHDYTESLEKRVRELGLTL